MSVRLHQLVLALLADRWRRQWHNVAVAAGLAPLAVVAWWAADAGWGSS